MKYQLEVKDSRICVSDVYPVVKPYNLLYVGKIQLKRKLQKNSVQFKYLLRQISI